jgi:hypothetical protein
VDGRAPVWPRAQGASSVRRPDLGQTPSRGPLFPGACSQKAKGPSRELRPFGKLDPPRDGGQFRYDMGSIHAAVIGSVGFKNKSPEPLGGRG